MHQGIQKLKLEKYKTLLLWDLPQHQVQEFKDKENKISDELVLTLDKKEKPFDGVIATALNLQEMEQKIDAAWDEALLSPNGYLYLLYPKKGNKLYDQFVPRDDIMTLDMDEEGYFKNTDLKFSKMLAYDANYTVLGVKYQVKKKKPSKKPSQLVEDYVHRVEELQTLLAEDVKLIYQSLTPGYQKDWARYVYSAVQEETQQKRIQEMHQILKLGYKTKQLYQASQKKNKPPDGSFQINRKQ